MTAIQRRSRRRAVSVLLIATWAAFLIVQCRDCPGAATRFARCATAATVVSVGAKSHGVMGDCHRAPADAEHPHLPGSDCCDSVERPIATVAPPPATDAPPAAALLPAMVTPPAARIIQAVRRNAPAARHSHDPPRYLALRSLLI